MEIPQEGKYVCKLNGQLVIYQASTGSLCGAMPCAMIESGFTFKHTLVLVKSDETILTKNIDTLKAVFGWDGENPFWLMDNSDQGGAMREVEFEIVGGPELSDKGTQYFKSQWLNPLGGGMRTPQAADRRSVLAKYGSKFQALAGVGGRRTEDGGRSGATGASLPPPPATRASLPPSTPRATMEETWVALNEANPGKAAAEVEKVWFDTIARLFPNKTNTELKPHEWGKLKQEFSDNVPM